MHVFTISKNSRSTKLILRHSVAWYELVDLLFFCYMPFLCYPTAGLDSASSSSHLRLNIASCELWNVIGSTCATKKNVTPQYIFCARNTLSNIALERTRLLVCFGLSALFMLWIRAAFKASAALSSTHWQQQCCIEYMQCCAVGECCLMLRLTWMQLQSTEPMAAAENHVICFQRMPLVQWSYMSSEVTEVSVQREVGRLSVVDNIFKF